MRMDQIHAPGLCYLPDDPERTYCLSLPWNKADELFPLPPCMRTTHPGTCSTGQAQIPSETRQKQTSRHPSQALGSKVLLLSHEYNKTRPAGPLCLPGQSRIPEPWGSICYEQCWHSGQPVNGLIQADLSFGPKHGREANEFVLWRR